MFIAEKVADGPFTSEKKKCCATGLIKNPASGLSEELYMKRIIRLDFFPPQAQRVLT